MSIRPWWRVFLNGYPGGGIVPPTIRWMFGFLAVLALIAGACGDDDDDATVAEEPTESVVDDTAASDDETVDLSAYGTERPEGLVGGVVFDAMVFLTYPEEMAVCTAETMLSSTSEEELVAAGIESIEESAVEAALECGADEEAMESLRSTVQRSELNSGESG